MNTVVENIIEEPVANTTDFNKSSGSNDEALDEQEASKASSEFAIKLVNSVKSLNNEEITHYELVNLFNSACLLYTSPSPRDGLLSRMPSSA